ncbi:MAG: GGDEF domain-containing protein [Pseudomonadota bacterium]
MNLVEKLIGRSASPKQASNEPESTGLVDGSLDTLDAMLRATGEFAVEVEDEDPRFHDLCVEYARHVTNGTPILDEGIGQQADGSRDWARVRRFFVNRRELESEFVTHRISNYRMLVEDMVTGLRSISSGEANTQQAVMRGLDNVQESAKAGNIGEIRQAIAHTMEAVTTAFNEQQDLFQAQIEQSNQRMLSLRGDLAAAREHLKRDPLTDTFNRGAFDIAIQQTVAMNFVLRQPVCIAMLDLDHFKKINDKFGHSAGDDVLRGVSDCLSRTFVRRSDVVARYGGEEFALILNDVTLETAHTLLTRLMEMIRSTVSIPYANKGDVLTCSAGVTQLRPSDTVETVLRRADSALYRAKSDGRDRIHMDQE